jgi:Zn-dependent peptidase ImmA (M78 family)
MNLPDPEATACLLREQAHQTKPPIDLTVIARQFPRLIIKEMELDGEGLFIDLAERGAEIYLKKDANEFRKRFTLAHELGHLVLAESGGHPVGYRNSRRIRSAIESWCNTFAANLLMPKADVLQFLRKAKLPGLIEALSSGPRAFRVSHQAFRMRACEIAPLIVYVFDTDGKSYKLREFFLSNIRHDLRWTDGMNSIVSPMLKGPKTRAYVVHTGDTIIVGGYPKATLKRGEFLAAVVARSANEPAGISSSPPRDTRA